MKSRVKVILANDKLRKIKFPFRLFYASIIGVVTSVFFLILSSLFFELFIFGNIKGIFIFIVICWFLLVTLIASFVVLIRYKNKNLKSKIALIVVNLLIFVLSTVIICLLLWSFVFTNYNRQKIKYFWMWNVEKENQQNTKNSVSSQQDKEGNNPIPQFQFCTSNDIIYSYYSSSMHADFYLYQVCLSDTYAEIVISQVQRAIVINATRFFIPSSKHNLKEEFRTIMGEYKHLDTSQYEDKTGSAKDTETIRFGDEALYRESDPNLRQSADWQANVDLNWDAINSFILKTFPEIKSTLADFQKAPYLNEQELKLPTSRGYFYDGRYVAP